MQLPKQLRLTPCRPPYVSPAHPTARSRPLSAPPSLACRAATPCLRPQVHNALGYAFFNMEKTDAAVAEYRKAVQLQPGYVTGEGPGEGWRVGVGGWVWG